MGTGGLKSSKPQFTAEVEIQNARDVKYAWYSCWARTDPATGNSVAGALTDNQPHRGSATWTSTEYLDTRENDVYRNIIGISISYWSCVGWTGGKKKRWNVEEIHRKSQYCNYLEKWKMAESSRMKKKKFKNILLSIIIFIIVAITGKMIFESRYPHFWDNYRLYRQMRSSEDISCSIDGCNFKVLGEDIDKFRDSIDFSIVFWRDEVVNTDNINRIGSVTFHDADFDYFHQGRIFIYSDGYALIIPGKVLGYRLVKMPNMHKELGKLKKKYDITK